MLLFSILMRLDGSEGQSESGQWKAGMGDHLPAQEGEAKVDPRAQSGPFQDCRVLGRR